MIHPAVILLTPVLPERERLADMGMRIGITIVVAFLIQRALFLIWNRLAALLIRAANEERAAVQRVQTLKHILRHLTTVVVSLFAVVRILEILGWDVKPLLAGAGILGVALGFGAQTLVRDWIAGFFILIENQFGVGDVVEINGRPATVELLTVRSTRLRDANGYVLYVPNGEMRIVTNRTRDWNRLMVDVPIRAGQDLDLALERCREAAARMGADPIWEHRLFEPVRVWGVERLGADVTIRMAVRTRPGAEAAEAARELRLRVHQALAAAGIRYPREAHPAGAENEPQP